MQTIQNPATGKTIDGAKVTTSRMFDNYSREAAEGQRKALLSHLNTYGRITTMEAREMGILSPNGVIYRLRKRGHRIKTERVKVDGHRVASYRLMTPEEIAAEEEKCHERADK